MILKTFLFILGPECAANASCVQNDNLVNECVCNEGYTGDGLVECEGLNLSKYNKQ